MRKKIKRTCIDCGVGIETRNAPAKRCETCSITRLRIRRRDINIRYLDKRRSQLGLPPSVRKRVIPGRQLGLCKIQGCDRISKARSMCGLHYSRLRNKSNIPMEAPKTKPIEGCKFKGCNRSHMAKGLCGTHYEAFRTGRPMYDLNSISIRSSEQKLKCDLCGVIFERSHVRSRNYCSPICNKKGALERIKERSKERRILKIKQNIHNKPKSTCRQPGCEEFAAIGDLCSLHNGLEIFDEDSYLQAHVCKPIGYIRLNTTGYKDIKVSKTKWSPEHRFVMENKIGRSLKRNEEVHHINGDRTDNSIENLELWSSSHPVGQRVVDKLVWAREIIATYGDLLDRVLLAK